MQFARKRNYSENKTTIRENPNGKPIIIRYKSSPIISQEKVRSSLVIEQKKENPYP